MDNPKCFISYSWDSKEHQDWVRRLAETLHMNGVETQLDQWDLKPGQDMTAFMEYSIRSSNFVLLICTENYATKSNDGSGGVGYEKSIVTGEIFTTTFEQIKYIPVLKGNDAKTSLPSFLKAKLYIDFREESNFGENIEELLRTIYNAPKFEKPTLGEKPNFTKPLLSRYQSLSSPTLKEEFINFTFNEVLYKFTLPDWWNDIQVDISHLGFSDKREIDSFCKRNFGEDVGTKSTWKSALKAHALYNHKYNQFPVYIGHCASAGKEFELAAKIYSDLFQLVHFWNDQIEWYHTYLAYETAGEYEALGQISLAISWYKKATEYISIGTDENAIKYYAGQSLMKIKELENIAFNINITNSGA